MSQEVSICFKSIGFQGGFKVFQLFFVFWDRFMAACCCLLGERVSLSGGSCRLVLDASLAQGVGQGAVGFAVGPNGKG